MYCPNKRCANLFELPEGTFDPNGTNITVCHSCSTEICHQCAVAWHTGLNCTEYRALPPDERAPEDRMVLELATKNKWKRCPKCHVVVSLTSGCNHITCTCRHHFCYTCGGDWIEAESRCSNRCALWNDEEQLLDERVRPARERPIYIDEDRPAVPVNNHFTIQAINLEFYARRRTGPWLGNMLRADEYGDHACGYCNRQFRGLRALGRHLSTTTRHPVFSCCGKVFPTEEAMDRHQQT